MAVAVTLRERRKAETRAAILAAAAELFAARGYDAVTTADVAAQAGVGVRTLFRYFPRKQDLLRAETLAGALAARPADEPVGAALAAAMASAARASGRVYGGWEEALAEGLEARGQEPAAARLLARVAIACHDEAVGRWLADPDPERPGLARRTRANLGRVGRLLSGS